MIVWMYEQNKREYNLGIISNHYHFQYVLLFERSIESDDIRESEGLGKQISREL